MELLEHLSIPRLLVDLCNVVLGRSILKLTECSNLFDGWRQKTWFIFSLVLSALHELNIDSDYIKQSARKPGGALSTIGSLILHKQQTLYTLLHLPANCRPRLVPI